MKERLRLELAAALFARDLLSFGKASELAGSSRFHFDEVVPRREIARHYGQKELSEDLTYADGE